MGIEKELREKGIYITKTNGDSMSPMLISGKSRVVIEKPYFPLKKYDVPVYRRDGHYTMHRIIGFTRSGGYIICGDNRVCKEYDITNSDIIGVLTGFYNGKRFVSCSDKTYMKYAKRVCRIYYLRYAKHLFESVKNKIMKIAHQKAAKK